MAKFFFTVRTGTVDTDGFSFIEIVDSRTNETIYFSDNQQALADQYIFKNLGATYFFKYIELKEKEMLKKAPYRVSLIKKNYPKAYSFIISIYITKYLKIQLTRFKHRVVDLNLSCISGSQKLRDFNKSLLFTGVFYEVESMTKLSGHVYGLSPEERLEIYEYLMKDALMQTFLDRLCQRIAIVVDSAGNLDARTFAIEAFIKKYATN